jgi:hypothetical protein
MDIHAIDPPFRVIRLTNGSDVHWSGADPNRLVFEFLKKRKAMEKQAEGTSADQGK